MTYHLGDMIQEAGGVTAANFDQLVGHMRDAFVQLGSGKFDKTQARKVIDDNFKAFLDVATAEAKKTGGILNSRIREFVTLDAESGLGSTQVAQMVADQVKSGVEGIGLFLQTADEARSTVKDLEGQLESASRDQRAGLEAQLAKARQVVEALSLTESSAAALGGMIAGDFAAQLRAGLSPLEALKGVQPEFEALKKQLEAGGFGGGEAFDRLSAKFALVNDQVAGPILTGITSLTQGMVGFYNAGMLDADMFAGLTGQIGGMWTTLDEGQKADALSLMGPQLQGIWQVWKDTNWQIDDNTRAMLEDAEAAGLVGEEHKSANEQMIDGLTRIGDVLEGIAKAFGVELPQSAKDGAKGVADAMKDIPRDIKESVSTTTSAASTCQREPTPDGRRGGLTRRRSPATRPAVS